MNQSTEDNSALHDHSTHVLGSIIDIYLREAIPSTLFDEISQHVQNQYISGELEALTAHEERWHCIRR
jgi:hypothetical protein